MTAPEHAEAQNGHFIHANGLEIYYQEHGQGHPLILIHGGILNGESLLAWRCFFPFGTTIGIDIEAKPGMAGGRTRVYTADQGSAADLDMVCEREGPFDIIVDDGSHLSHHQIFTFERLFPSLKEGGVYVIEDVQTSFWPGAEMGAHWDGAHLGTPAFGNTCYGVFVELAKYLNHKPTMPGRWAWPILPAATMRQSVLARPPRQHT